MPSPGDAHDRLRRAADEEREAYTGGADHPVGGYAGAMGVYVAGIAALAGVARLARRPVPEPGPWDVLLCAGATHRLSRLVAKDPVTSPLRAPFTRFRGTTGPAELDEEVRGSGGRKVVGELLTCPFCTGMWIVTGLAAGLVLAPRPTRLATAALTALTGSDLLHFLRVRMQQAVGE
ncbi:DUF1360 domain-containing protein [Streptomyces sp. I05A-00742]|uniref:DUF1360 domain-containing protein n=1 Tax=Streptomyces sp. I05A-00742 TaxID=2732853 RepID=UPI0014887987|nr:DUF1360 domain-containing protein [Streptomyces sp. I05A-00742]